MVVTREELEKMRGIDIETVDPDTLKDISEVKIDKGLSREERIAQFIEQIGNPYCFKCNGMVVKLSFADTDITLEDRLEEYRFLE